MQTITRFLDFDYGHRVLGHEGKCKYLHGHRGRADITVSSDALDSLGRVLDFSCIKDLVGGWVQENWDHNLLLHPLDPLWGVPQEVFMGRVPYELEVGNPTAENMARELYGVSERLLQGKGVTLVSVTIWETPNSRATFSREES